MTARFAELLTNEQVEQVHEAALEILKNVGMLVRNEEARQQFKAHGCQVDAKTLIVKFPNEVIEYYLQSIPSTFTIQGRDPSFDRTLPADGPLFVTGSSAPDIIDHKTGQRRRAISDDIANIAYLVNELPGYDILSIPVTADDAPPGQFSLSRFYPALKNCAKPVFGSAPSMDELDPIIKLGSLIAGSEAAFWERPFITFGYCPLVSPLTMDVESTEKLMRFTELGIPSYGIGAPNAGLSAPLTMMGTLALANAEFLAQSTLEQIIRPGKPIIYCSLPTVADIRTGAYAPGAIETGVLVMGCAQMARYYNIPSDGFVGLSNAKTNDAQSGFETGMSTTAALLAGTNILRFGSLLDALMVFDFAKAVIDNEIALMLKQAARGLQYTVDDFALEVIAETGPGGIFMNKKNTIERMRTTAFLPEITDRLTWRQWELKGKPGMQTHAMQKVHEIFKHDNRAAFSPEVDERIRTEFDGLVSGDASAIGITTNPQ